MARKTKRTARKKPATGARKTAAKRRPAAKRKTSTPVRSAGTARKTAKGSAARAGKSSDSVDALLKRFARERADREAELVSLGKKRRDAEEKVARLNETISKLRQQENAARSRIAEIEQQRDREVRELLDKLGVRVGGHSRGPSGRELNRESRESREKETRQPADRPRPQNAPAAAAPQVNGREE